MKNLIALVGLLLASALPARAATPPPTYVTVVRVTPGAAPTHILAFQNTSATLSIQVRRIEIVNASTQTVSGGQAQYWTYGSTQVTHSASAGTTSSYASANASAPSFLTVSTAPLSVQIEGDSASLTAAQRNALSGVPPLIRPLVVDNDDAATVNRSDAWSSEEQAATQDAPNPLALPAGANRALVIEKRQGAASDFTAGAVLIRIFWTYR